MIHLEVAGMKHSPRRRLDRDSKRIGNRVINGDEFNLEVVDRNDLALRDLAQLCLDPVLTQLRRDQTESQLRSVDRNIHPFPE